MDFKEKIMHIQSELKAPKSQYNSFGKYYYRSCEDILEAVKQLLLKYKCIMTISDSVTGIGNNVYVQAEVKISDCESDGCISNTALAREAVTKKGMDDSQITGTASSYARKYALNGLFCIDDTKDADTNEYHNNNKNNNDTQSVQSSNNTQSEKIICPVCQTEVKAQKKSDGTVVNAKTVFEKCGGMCYKCYQNQTSEGETKNAK